MAAPEGIARRKPPQGWSGLMNGKYDRLQAAQQDLDLLCNDLTRVSAQLEELATAWRRDHISGMTARDLPLTFPGTLRAETQQLAGTLWALVDAGPGQPPGLALSAVAQLAALQGDVTAAAEDGFGRVAGAPPGSAVWASIEHALERAGKRLWSLISHLVPVREWTWTEQAGPGLLGNNLARVSVTFVHTPDGQPGASP